MMAATPGVKRIDLVMYVCYVMTLCVGTADTDATVALNSPSYLERFLYCHNAHSEVRRLCKRVTESCANRCGEFLKRDGRRVDEYSCSCDSLCYVYNDCCWDLRYKCPRQWDEGLSLYDTMSGPVAGCDLGNAVIVGRKDHAENPPHAFDSREPVVTYRDIPGLHFIDRRVVQMFFSDKIHQKHLLPWRKHIEVEATFFDLLNSSTTEVKRFFTHGEIGENLKDFISNIPPPSVTPRRCASFGVKLTCSSVRPVCSDSENGYLVSNSSAELCRQTFLHPEHPVSNSPTPFIITTPTTTVVNAELSWSVAPQVENVWLCTLETLNKEKNNRGFTVFSVTMSLSRYGGLKIANLTFSDALWLPVFEELEDFFQTVGIENQTDEIEGEVSPVDWSPFSTSTMQTLKGCQNGVGKDQWTLELFAITLTSCMVCWIWLSMSTCL